MPIFSDLLPSDSPGFGQQGKGFGTSFDGARLDASGSVAHTLLCDQDEQRTEPALVIRAGVAIPGAPQLQGVFEAEFAWVARAERSCLDHHQPDEVVGQQIDPDFFLRHRRGLAAQYFHAEGGLDMTKVEFDVPALTVQGFQVRLGRLRRAQQRGHENLATSGEFPHGQGLWCLRVLFRRHPVQFENGFAQFDQMIACAKPLPAAKVG